MPKIARANLKMARMHEEMPEERKERRKGRKGKAKTCPACGRPMSRNAAMKGME